MPKLKYFILTSAIISLSIGTLNAQAACPYPGWTSQSAGGFCYETACWYDSGSGAWKKMYVYRLKYNYANGSWCELGCPSGAGQPAYNVVTWCGIQSLPPSDDLSVQ